MIASADFWTYTATRSPEHDHIVKALLAGDSELAGNLLRAHVNVQGKRFSDLIETLAEQSNANELLPAG